MPGTNSKSAYRVDTIARVTFVLFKRNARGFFIKLAGVSRHREKHKSILILPKHNIAIGAVHYRFQCVLLLCGNFELIQDLLKIIHECDPFVKGDVQMAVRIHHRTARIFLWPPVTMQTC